MDTSDYWHVYGDCYHTTEFCTLRELRSKALLIGPIVAESKGFKYWIYADGSIQAI